MFLLIQNQTWLWCQWVTDTSRHIRLFLKNLSSIYDGFYKTRGKIRVSTMVSTSSGKIFVYLLWFLQTPGERFVYLLWFLHHQGKYSCIYDGFDITKVNSPVSTMVSTPGEENIRVLVVSKPPRQTFVYLQWFLHHRGKSYAYLSWFLHQRK